MESKILIDINYASREPQIVVHQKDSDDPRDKLISMLLGESMPGVADGYCRIERYPDQKAGADVAVITPVHPVDLIKHIPAIAKLAEENACCDTSSVPAEYRKIIESEWSRVKGDIGTEAVLSTLKAADQWAVENLSTELYIRWCKDIFGHGPHKTN